MGRRGGIGLCLVALRLGPWIAAILAWTVVAWSPRETIDLVCRYPLLPHVLDRNEWRCLGCHHHLRSAQGRCPECGRPFDEHDTRTVCDLVRRRKLALITMTVLLFLGPAAFHLVWATLFADPYLGSWTVPFVAIVGVGLLVGIVSTWRMLALAFWLVGGIWLAVNAARMHG